ncbi:MAG: helix-turn-helix domain-containing protein [Clostridia bacterium]|nr:helix-turn-helix domain-containing protein [Clostridia bacterium]
MKSFLYKNYQEYRISIGNADFVFFSDITAVSRQQVSDTTLHSHKFYELFHVLRGSITIATETQERDFHEKDTVILAPGVFHSTFLHAESMRFSMVFTIEKNPKVSNSSYYESFCEILNEDVTVLEAFMGSHAFHRCARYFQSDYIEKDELITSCLHEIVALMKVTKFDDQKLLPSDILTNTNHSRNYIIDDYFVNKFHNGSLENLAELLNLSPQQTQRIIKKLYSQSFSERIAMMKMNYAKTLLQHTNLSVTNIAEKCGYSRTNGFFVAFKKYYNKTPNELRKEANE